jgi:hypothetical protein
LEISGLAFSGFKKKISGLAISGPENKLAMPTSVNNKFIVIFGRNGAGEATADQPTISTHGWRELSRSYIQVTGYFSNFTYV